MLTVVLVVAVLHFARSLLIPMAVAAIVAFVLSPVASRLERWGLGRVGGVAVTMLAALLLVAAVTWVIAQQALSLAADLPSYRVSIRQKLHALAQQTDSWTGRAAEGLATLQDELRHATSGPGDPPTHAGAPIAAPAPAPVTADDPGPLPGSLTIDGLPVVGEWAMAAVIVVVFASFALLKREDLRDRTIALAGSERISFTTQVVDDAARRVSRFLSAQLLVNIAFGTVIAAGLWVIGVPNAILFGALVVPLRFVPVIGLWIATGTPTLVAAITQQGWQAPLLTLALFAVVEVVVAYIVEPWAFSARTGISSVAVLLSLVFWTWLWGPMGLVLAMPLTVCLAAMVRHLPRHRWLSLILDERPALPESARVYQRLLALDAEEAEAVAQKALAASGLERTYDEVLVPALAMLEEDRVGGSMPAEQVAFVRSSARAIIDLLAVEASELGGGAGRPVDGALARPASAPGEGGAGILCVPAWSESDELAGLMLANLLRLRGRHVELISATALITERAEAARRVPTGVVCLSALPPAADARTRLLCQKLRHEAPTARIVAGLWGSRRIDAQRPRLQRVGAEVVVSTLGDAVRTIAGETAAR